MEEKRLEIEQKREETYQRELKARQQGGISLAKRKANNEKAKKAKGNSLNKGRTREAEKIDKIPSIRKKGSRPADKKAKKDQGKEEKAVGKKPLKMIMNPQAVKAAKSRKVLPVDPPKRE